MLNIRAFFAFTVAIGKCDALFKLYTFRIDAKTERWEADEAHAIKDIYDGQNQILLVTILINKT